jgi:hypothetical protein
MHNWFSDWRATLRMTAALTPTDSTPISGGSRKKLQALEGSGRNPCLDCDLTACLLELYIICAVMRPPFRYSLSDPPEDFSSAFSFLDHRSAAGQRSWLLGKKGLARGYLRRSYHFPEVQFADRPA